MIVIKRHTGPGVWLDPLTYSVRAIAIGEKGRGTRFITMMSCLNRHIASLSDHEIADDGTVTPSVVCPELGCDFHEMVKLEDWTKT